MAYRIKIQNDKSPQRDTSSGETISLLSSNTYTESLTFNNNDVLTPAGRAVSESNQFQTELRRGVNSSVVNQMKFNPSSFDRNQIFDYDQMRSFTQPATVGDDENATGFTFVADTSFTEGSEFFRHLRDLYYKDSSYVNYPKVIYHSTDTALLFSDNKLITNDFNLDQDDVYKIKEKYADEKLKNITSKFFLESNSAGLNRKNYYSNLLNYGKEIKEVDFHLNNFINKKNRILQEFNFGNHIRDYFLNDKTSKRIGKIAEFLLENEIINSRPNNFFIENQSDSLFLNESRLGNNVIEQASLENCYKIIFSVSKEENVSFDRIENTDAMIGQLFSNNSLSLKYLYKDCWDSNKAISNLESNEAEQFHLLNSEYVQKSFTVIKNISLLSLSDSNKATFNPYVKEANNTDSVSSEDSYFENKTNVMLKENPANKNLFESFKFFAYSTLPFYSNYSIFKLNNEYVTLKNVFSEILQQSESQLQIPVANLSETKVNSKVFKNISEVDLFNTSLYTPFMFRDIKIKEYSYSIDRSFGGTGEIDESENNGIKENTHFNPSFYFDIFPYENLSLSNTQEILTSPKFLFVYDKNDQQNGLKGSPLKIPKIFLEGQHIFFPREVNINSKQFRDDRIHNKSSSQSFKFEIPTISERNNSSTYYYKFKDILSWPIKYFMLDDPGLSLDNRTDILKFKKVLDSGEDSVYKPLKNIFNYNIQSYLRQFDSVKILAANFDIEQPSFSEKQQNNRSYLGTGHILLRNSQKEHELNDMKNKFIFLDDDLTDPSENFTSRLVSYSNSITSNVNNSIKHIAEPLKSSCFENKLSSNGWPSFTSKLHKSLQNLKKFKIKKNGKISSKKIIKFYENFLAKNIDINSDFSLLYGDESELSIDSFNKSIFLQEINGNFYSKNNIQTSQPGVNNKVDLSIEGQIEDLDITSKEYKEFLSEYYPSGILKNSKNLFKRILDHILFEFKTRQNDLYFLKMLSSCIRDKKEITKVLIYSHVYKSRTNNDLNIKNNIDNKLKNDTLSNSIKEYINTISSIENIQKQKSYTLRTVNFPNGIMPSYNYTDDFFVGMMPGNIYQFLFPAYEYKYCLKDSLKGELSTPISVDRQGEYLNNNANPRFILELFNTYTYNYDSYLSSPDNVFEDGIIKISHIVKENNMKKMLPVNEEESVLTFAPLDSANRGEFVYDILSSNRDEFVADDKLSPELNYKFIKYSIRDKVISKYSNHFYFKTIKEILEYLDIVELKNASNKEEIGNYINQNEDLVDEIKSILELTSEIYESIYSLYEDFTLSSRISEIIKKENKDNYKDKLEQSDIIEFGDGRSGKENYAKGVELNQDVIENIVESIESILSEDDEVCKLEQFTLSNTKIYTKLHEEIQKTINSLNNSKILEAISHDIVFSYLHDFEEKENKLNQFNSHVNEVSNFISESFFNNIGLTLDVKDILNSPTKLCKIYKKIIEKYYQYELFKNYLQNSTNINVMSDDYKNIFKNFIIDKDLAFKTYLDKEECIQKLVNSGKQRLYFKDSSQKVFINGEILDENNNVIDTNFIDDFKYDVLDNRFEVVKLGIGYDIAKVLLNQKILQIKINIFNHKYPELQFNPLEIYYTPTLTSLPTFSPLMINSGEDLNRYLGFYNFKGEDSKDMFLIVNADEAFINARNILLNSKAIGRNLSDDAVTLISNILVNSHITSNAIKYANLNNQKFLNEDNINDVGDILGNYIGRNMSRHYFDMSRQEFENIFGHEIDVFNQSVITDEESIRRISKMETVKNKNHAYEFFDAFNQYVSTESIYENFIDNKYFDIFSFKISHTDILSRLVKEINDNQTYENQVNEYLKDKSSKNSYSYIIEADIL